MQARAVLFDFDYTLADSSEAIVDCFNFALRELGLLPAPPPLIRRTIGLTLEDSLAAVAGEPWAPPRRGVSPALAQALRPVMVARTRLLDGAPAAVETLHDGGLRLGVVSTKYRCRIEEVLDRELLRHRFDLILGGDDVMRHKPDPEGLLLALERLNLSASQAIYVGDSVVDAEAAVAAGVRFVGVLTGVTREAELARWKPLRILPSLAELPPLLGRGRNAP